MGYLAHRRTAVLVVLVLAMSSGVPFWPELAGACSCFRPADWGFLHERDAVIPSNARGLAWWGHEGVAPSDFQVVRVGPFGEVPVPFRLSKPAIPIPVHRLGTMDSLVLVEPVEPMRSGQRYRFRTRKHHMTNGTTWSRRQQVQVTVSDEALDLKTVPLRLAVGPLRRGTVEIALGLVCSIDVDATLAEVHLELPPAQERFREHLLFQTVVNARPFTHAYSLCAILRPGRSWQAGAGTDTVFTTCRDGDGLAPGRYNLAMVVVFIAADGVQVRHVEGPRVELRCPP